MGVTSFRRGATPVAGAILAPASAVAPRVIAAPPVAVAAPVIPAYVPQQLATAEGQLCYYPTQADATAATNLVMGAIPAATPVSGIPTGAPAAKRGRKSNAERAAIAATQVAAPAAQSVPVTLAPANAPVPSYVPVQLAMPAPDNRQCYYADAAQTQLVFGTVPPAAHIAVAPMPVPVAVPQPVAAPAPVTVAAHIPVTAQPLALVPAPTAQLHVPEYSGTVASPLAKIGTVTGDYDSNDFNLARLAIVQNVGELCVKSRQTPGSIVLCNGNDITPLPMPLDFLILSMRKIYIENLTEDERKLRAPNVLNSKEEVHRSGGWTNWVNNQRPPYSDAASLVVAIANPTDANGAALPGYDALFNIPHASGISFALAQWTISNTQYRRVGKVINDIVIRRWQGDTTRSSFQITLTEQQEAGDVLIWVPKVEVLLPEESLISALNDGAFVKSLGE